MEKYPLMKWNQQIHFVQNHIHIDGSWKLAHAVVKEIVNAFYLKRVLKHSTTYWTYQLLINIFLETIDIITHSMLKNEMK